jgi:hypothetical protein
MTSFNHPPTAVGGIQPTLFTLILARMRAVLYRCPNVAQPDLVANVRRLSWQIDFEFRSLSDFAE